MIVRRTNLACLIAALLAAACTDAAHAEALRFETDVRPILKAACFHCHGEEKKKRGGLDIRLVHLMQTGGDSGAAVVPGDPDASLLWQQVASDEMPDGPKKLTADQKQVIRDWIAQGAKTVRPEPKDPDTVRFTEEELGHWAFQPVKIHPIPQPDGFDIRTPIDAFVAERLAKRGLRFSPRAKRETLIRRITHDLTGLPPTAAEVEAFVGDETPQAWPRLVERLLSSPEFGVRWGRHWLDVAGYAESDGGGGNDTRRPNAWHYRDYVFESFNRNKPIDQFLREQIAGDELIDGKPDTNDPRHVELLTATGFMRMAPDPTQSSNSLAERNQAAADAVQVIGSSTLGLTVGCAQCHDHKYDPIGIDDYYRFRAIFDPVFPLQKWQQPSARLVDVTSAEDQKKAEEIEARAKEMDAAIQAKKTELAKTIQAAKLSDVPEEVREETLQAVLASAKDRTERQKELLDLYPMVKPVSFIAGFLVEYDNAAYREFEKQKAEVTKVRETKPPKRLVRVATEQPDVVPVSAVLFRGNPNSPGEKVQPGELAVLSQAGKAPVLPVNESTRTTTGRRIAYASHLTSGQHPLTARVFVNRIWQHHFGQGIVDTPGDFGLNGEPPSHPELLDWLAADFVKHGWDQKRLHRMILLSTVYQQSARRTPELDAIDPENRLLARANLRRLEAEAVRDFILATTGDLNLESGGPSIPVTTNAEGKVVIGVTKIRDGLAAGVRGQNEAAYRRSAFIESNRSLPLNMLATFDLPEMKPNCDRRRSTTVATQSLWFLNDDQIIGLTGGLADRLFTNHPTEADQRLDALFRKLFATAPTDEEQQYLSSFLERQEELFRADPNAEWQKKIKAQPDAPARRSLAALAQVLMASNRFLYID
ncbi:MAG: PSD1 and planctomycete cytochrome C domain-containing protein [Verrucomicrobiales bacterium]|nr:PSD1 and planctomycete cytochrome C domain-containing protein [Verrucomicrobiales bacterium]